MKSVEKVTPDRGHIANGGKNEMICLSRHLGVSEKELLRAVEKVGNSISAVRKELGK
jgi:hypothetical protein